MYQRYVTLLSHAGLGMCVALAVVSTAAWYLLTELSELADGSSSLPTRWDEVPAWLLIWSSGAIYAALVLFRYLDPHGASWRPVAVFLAGALSYWIGVQYSTVLRPADSMIFDTAAAGVITAAFVGYITIRLGTLRFANPQFLALCVAGGVGGAVIGWSASNDQTLVPGHAIWQVLTCVALYYSPRSPAERNRARPTDR